jgi:UDP-N-acetylglucosamine acyltransferase
VRIGAGTVVGPHVVIEGHTTIGKDNKIFQFCSLGAAPQDKKWAGEPTRLEVGDRNTIREFVHLQPGHRPGRRRDPPRATTTGSRPTSTWRTTARSAATRSSRTTPSWPATCIVGDWAILSGYAGVHQFCKIGAHAFIGMYTSLTQDVPPFVLVSGNRPARAASTSKA